ncbi:hypothetical protein [Micromonospora sp. WMMA1947]|uniref:hypothetical protein n=1 Tax=Micromonospora sp. WMMA1947 TaxID=3015163 RepID=UPI00248C3278|nr:hypothetical protein [Micromonospora sp. WMMA1947]WBC09464.1 hypothetical protein O7604_00805 [Micromonospora sp. WMMA1947]
MTLHDLLGLVVSSRVLYHMASRLRLRGIGNPRHHSTQFLGHLWVIAEQVLQPRCPCGLLLQADPLILSPSRLHCGTGAFKPLLNGSGPSPVASPEQLSKPALSQLPRVGSYRTDQRRSTSAC